MLCKKCNQPFSINIWIDGKKRHLQRRKYCLVCSPFGKHNTRKLDIISTSKACKICGKSFNRKGKYCDSCRVSEWRRKKKIKLIDYKGGKCVICGYNRCAGNLVFHHRDPNEKDFGISGMTVGYDKLLKEADKCALLCSNCHGEVHAGLIKI